LGINNRSNGVGYLDVVNNQTEHVGHLIMADGNGARATVLAQVEGVGSHCSCGRNVIASSHPGTILQHIAVTIACPAQISRFSANIGGLQVAGLEAARAVHGIGGLDAVGMSATIVATCFLGDDLTGSIVNRPTIFSAVAACGIDEVDHSTGAKSKLVVSGAATCDGISAINLASVGINHFHFATTPAVIIGVGEGNGDGAHVFRHASVSGEALGVGIVAIFITAVGAHFHFVSGGQLELVEGVGAGYIIGHGAIHIDVILAGSAVPCYSGSGAASVTYS